MSARNSDVNALVERSYAHGFVTDIEADTVPPGLDEGIVRTLGWYREHGWV